MPDTRPHGHGPTPERILQVATGGWACAALGAAVRYSMFDQLEAGATAEQVAERAKLSTRGAQAVLDAITGLGFATVDHGLYRNAPDASTFLVRSKPTFMGGLVELNTSDLGRWSEVFDVVKSGTPKPETDVPENPFWEALVPSIAALSVPVAHLAAQELALSKAGPVRWLDVGGGSGIYSAIWLSLNREARGVQLDWPNVNRIAKGIVARHGAADRFETIDGDFHTTDFRTGYDFGLYSHIAHQETPEDNVEIFRKFRRAIRPGGTLVVNDFILNDDRTGHPFALLFHVNMMMVTRGGASWRRADYLAWLTEAGFRSVTFRATPTPATLVFAK